MSHRISLQILNAQPSCSGAAAWLIEQVMFRWRVTILVTACLMTLVLIGTLDIAMRLGFNDRGGGMTWALAGIAISTACAIAVWTRRALRQTNAAIAAHWLDSRYRLPDSLMTAEELSRDLPDGPLETLQILQTDRLAAALTPQTPWPRCAAHWAHAAQGVAIAFAAFHFFPNDGRRTVAASHVLPAVGALPDEGRSSPAGSRLVRATEDSMPFAAKRALLPKEAESRPQAQMVGQPLSTFNAASSENASDTSQSGSGQDLSVAKNDLAQALEALIEDSPPAHGKGDTSTGGTGIGESNKARRVEATKGDAEAGRTHLISSGTPSQGELVSMRNDTSQRGAPQQQREGQAQRDKLAWENQDRVMSAANASLGAKGGMAALQNQASEGLREGELRTDVGAESPSRKAVATRLGKLRPRPGAEGELTQEHVPTSFQGVRTPQMLSDADGKTVQEVIQVDHGLAPRYRRATQSYGIYLNRGTSQ